MDRLGSRRDDGSRRDPSALRHRLWMPRVGSAIRGSERAL